MGSGLGIFVGGKRRLRYNVHGDRVELHELGLDKIRFGDIVAIADSSSFYGRSYRKGAVIIGIVVHSNSFVSGHGRA
jgi:hypothetical protein